MTNPKYVTYLKARLAGMDDGEANEAAGFRGKTPGWVYGYLSAMQLLREQCSAWGDGPQLVQKMIDEWEGEKARHAAQIRRSKARLDEIERLLFSARLVLSSRNRDDEG